MDYPYFPLFIDLSGKNILVVGAGKIALRRIRILAQFTERLTVIAPEIHPELEPLESSGKLNVFRKEFELSDLSGADLVLAATNDETVNDLIWRRCKELGIPVNVSSDAKKSDFFFPGVARKDNFVIGVTAGGKDHAAAKRLTDRARKLLDETE